MNRPRWGTILAFLFAHPAFSRTRRHVRSYSIILSTALSIFTLFGGWSAIIMPTSSGQALAVANRSVITANYAIHMQIAASSVELSSQVLQMAVGPERVNLLNINLANPRVRLGVVQSNNRLLGSGEVLSSMANRTGAIAGINGDFFDGMGAPIGLVGINGQIVKSPGYYAVLGVTASGRLTMGPQRFSGHVTNGKVSHVLNSINHHGDIHSGKLVLFTPALGASLPCSGATVVTLLPAKDTTGVYTVRAVQSNTTRLPMLSDQNALVGSGEAGKWLASNLHAGNQINISKHLMPDTDLVQAIGGGPVLIKNGTLYNDPNPPAPAAANIRNPLTAIGVNKDGTSAFFVVADGRLSGPSRSRGFTRTEMAHYLLTRGAYHGMLFDGGGSSEMVARLSGQQRVSVINYPSDGYERRVANGLFVYLI